MIPLPIEVDDALDALRNARQTVGYAVDALNDLAAPQRLIDSFRQAHEALSWCCEHTAAAVAAAPAIAWGDTQEAVEVRHVDCQTFQYMNET